MRRRGRAGLRLTSLFITAVWFLLVALAACDSGDSNGAGGRRSDDFDRGGISGDLDAVVTGIMTTEDCSELWRIGAEASEVMDAEENNSGDLSDLRWAEASVRRDAAAARLIELRCESAIVAVEATAVVGQTTDVEAARGPLVALDPPTDMDLAAEEVSKLLSDFYKAWNRGVDDGAAFTAKHNYPGFYNDASECEEAINAEVVSFTTPHINRSQGGPWGNLRVAKGPYLGQQLSGYVRLNQWGFRYVPVNRGSIVETSAAIDIAAIGGADGAFLLVPCTGLDDDGLGWGVEDLFDVWGEPWTPWTPTPTEAGGSDSTTTIVQGGQIADPLAPQLPLHEGDSGPAVREVQHLLVVAGQSLYPYGVDGDFGLTTRGAVESFQALHGQPPTGVVDEATLAQLRLVERLSGSAPWDATAACPSNDEFAFTVAADFAYTGDFNIEYVLCSGGWATGVLTTPGFADGEVVLLQYSGGAWRATGSAWGAENVCVKYGVPAEYSPALGC